MNKKFTMKSLFLTLMLLVSAGAWADEVTYSFTDKSWGTAESAWTSGQDGAGYSNNGVQVTSNASGANATTNDIFENVSKIVVTYNTNKSKGAGSIAIKIGENEETENSVAYSSGDGTSSFYTTEFDYETPQTGAIQLTTNCTTNSIYVCSVTITYGAGDTPGTVAAPKFSPAAGAVAYGTEVTVSAAKDCFVTYTVDGTDPAESATAVTTDGNEATVTITAATTIRAIAVDADANLSEEASASYTIAAPAAPTFSPAAGAVAEGTTVTISAAADMIVYTTDGTDPSYKNNNGEIYTDPIAINAATTIKAIAVDGAGNESEVVTAAYTIKAAVSGYAIDFESDLDSYTDWTFTNIGTSNTTITAQGGSKYGANINDGGNGTATASIQTAAAVATPGELTFYISKVSNNTTASSWIVQVSEDAESWTNVETIDAKSMSKGEWKEQTVDLSSYTNVYVRISYDGSTAIRAIDDIELTMATPAAVAKPVFSLAEGSYVETQSVTITCETEGASIYYTLDGTEPDAESTLYTGAISVSTTTTIKAIAIKGSDESKVATVTYTFPTIYASIKDFIDAASSDIVYLRLTDAQVYYVNGKDMYIGDASAAICFYNCGLSYQAGDILNGLVQAKYTTYKNMNEITNATVVGEMSVEAGVPASIITDVETASAEDNHCRLVEVNGALSYDGSIYTLTDESNNSMKFYDKHKVASYDDLVGKTVAVKGIVVPFNSEIEICPISVAVVLGEEEITIGENGIATFASAKNFTFTGSGVKAFTAAYNPESGKVNLTEVQNVPAGAGVIIKADAGTYTIKEIESADALEGNELIGVTEDATAVAGDYVLAVKDSKVGFYPAEVGLTIKAGKAYLHVDEADAKAIFFDEATGIQNVKVAENNGAYYTISGLRVAQPTKGLYILNGKKVVVK